MDELKERRKQQNSYNEITVKKATEGLTHSEDEIPMVGESDVKLYLQI